MPGSLERLAQSLDGVSDNELLDALYVLRVPRDLVGIIPAAARYRDWRGKYPVLNAMPQLADYPRRLRLLDRIADLQIDDPVLRGEVTRHYKNRWTPLRPWTGDSVIGELLLVDVESRVDAAAFERVSAWVVWHAQRFHMRYLAPAAYGRYLRGEGRRLLEIAPGSRMYSAFLALHRLASADADARDNLGALATVVGRFGEGRSELLYALLEMGRNGQTPAHLAELIQAASGFGYDAQTLGQLARRTAGELPAELWRLLDAVWGQRIGGHRWHGGNGRAYGAHITRPLIRYSDRLLEMFDRADDDDVHAGTVIEFFPRPERVRGPETIDTEGDDPEDTTELDPPFSLFLATREDLIRGSYAAKGLQNALEYKNALLRWNKWTLSQTAIQAVVALVDGAPLPYAPIDRYGRLSIGLSLLTGRSLDEAAAVELARGDLRPSRNTPIVVDLGHHLLRVRTGRPQLRRPPRDLPQLCYPKAECAVLPLPPTWWPLLDALGPGHARSRRQVVRAARARLGRLDPVLHVTEMGVRQALLHKLDLLTHGDLGVRKVIADGDEVNARNIIHYASYPVSRIEAWWKEAAESLVGPLPDARAVDGDARVGSQHPFDVKRLAGHFADIKQRLRAAEAAGEWPRAFNLLTVYLAYWLGLGVTHRHALAPVPSILLDGDWVLVADKHRKDGSTDRLLPLTGALRAQIDAYVAFASALALAVPDLDPLQTSDSGVEVRLQYLHPKRGAVPYQPKYQERSEQLIHLPANWGRKVARSESSGLAGRYRDAELGHFVRGRHAWDATSTFNAPAFHAQWCERQLLLEGQLGLEVLVVAGCAHSARARELLPGRRIRAVPGHGEPRRPRSKIDRLQIQALLKDADPRAFAALMDSGQAFAPADAMDLVRTALETQEEEPPEWQRAIAEAACEWVRDQRPIPLFAVRPRLALTSRVLLDAPAMQTLAYMQQRILPAFAKDLACLPHAPQDTRQQRIELGRLTMIAIWRLGLMRWTLIDAWLRALCDGVPILAVGANRYMVLQVKSEAGRDLMQRTVFLDDFTSAYLCVGRETLRNNVLPGQFAHRLAQRRRAVVEDAMQAYLVQLDADDARITIADMAAAATQRLMLQSAPVLAAYARGELVTEDLGDRELRRLAGLAPRHKVETASAVAAPERQVADIRDLGFLRRQLHDRLPVWQLLAQERSPYRSYWYDQLGEYPCSSATEKLLCRFAAWLVAHEDPGVDGTVLSFRQRQHVARVTEVIALAIFGYAEADPDWKRIDGDLLTALSEVSHDQFPDRLRHGAWSAFHAYLRDPKAHHAGFEIGVLGPVPEPRVSAKILSAGELEEIASRLHSARSGIGNPELRISAHHHVTLMATFGMRRAESAFLRGIDFQGDLCRVQAYGDGEQKHTLKTAWADRPLPMALTAAAIREWVCLAGAAGFHKLIDPDAQTPAHPDNFYDAVSRLVKSVTGDDSMGSHHLRHTLISRVVLTLLQDAAALHEVVDVFPWIEGLLVPPAQMQTLFGTEGDAGQGLRALSALVGHSHPTTTVRSYVHVLCVALYAALHKVDTLDMTRSFENRAAGKSTVQRWATEIRGRAPDGLTDQQRRRWVNRALRDRIEERFEWAGIDRDETPRTMPGRPAETGDAEGNAPAWILFDRLEQVDRSFRERRELLDPAELAKYQAGLHWLAGIASGKKGTSLDKTEPKKGFEPHRHVLEEVRPGIVVPRRVAAGTATVAAEALCTWLGTLHVHSPADFDWLLYKWVHASERDRGRMRLDHAGEAERAKRLVGSPHVTLQITGTRVQTSRRRNSTKPLPLLRIMCLDGKGQLITRDTMAVRWVMSYVAARWHAYERSGGAPTVTTQEAPRTGAVPGTHGPSPSA